MDVEGNNPVLIAAQCKYTEILQYLIEDLQMDPKYKNYSGDTPLLIAC